MDAPSDLVVKKQAVDAYRKATAKRRKKRTKLEKQAGGVKLSASKYGPETGSGQRHIENASRRRYDRERSNGATRALARNS